MIYQCIQEVVSHHGRNYLRTRHKLFGIPVFYTRKFIY